MLTARQKRFVEEYLARGNGYRAAVTVGYAAPSARMAATRLLRVPEVADAVRRGQAEQRRRSIITADRLISELAAIAFADVGRMGGNGGDPCAPKPVHELAHEDRVAIAEARQSAGGVRLRLHDKLRALEKLSRLLGFGPADPTMLEDCAREAEIARQRLMRRFAKFAERNQPEKTIAPAPAPAKHSGRAG